MIELGRPNNKLDKSILILYIIICLLVGQAILANSAYEVYLFFALVLCLLYVVYGGKHDRHINNDTDIFPHI